MTTTTPFMSLSRLLWLVVGVGGVLGLAAALSIPAYRDHPTPAYSTNDGLSPSGGLLSLAPNTAYGGERAMPPPPASSAPMGQVMSPAMSPTMSDEVSQSPSSVVLAPQPPMPEALEPSTSEMRESEPASAPAGATPRKDSVQRAGADRGTAYPRTESAAQARAQTNLTADDLKASQAGKKQLAEVQTGAERRAKSERQVANVPSLASRIRPQASKPAAPTPVFENITAEVAIGGIAEEMEKDRDLDAVATHSADEKADKKGKLRTIGEAKSVADSLRGNRAAGRGRSADVQVLAKRPARRSAQGSVSRPRNVAERWLAARTQVESVIAQRADGYWANTYRPGDPAMRLLAARLRKGAPPALMPAVQRNQQPFDLPVHGAMAVYLQTDRSAVEGRTRVRLQVGLQATKRLSGWRPAMHVALVLDPDTNGNGWSTFEALALALAAARQPGDQFTLMLAGHDTPLVNAEDYRHGPVKLALAEAPRRITGRARSLSAALGRAYNFLREAQSRADAGLGASLVLLASTNAQGPAEAGLDTLVHRQALAGYALSALAAEGRGDLNALERLVGLGQGRLKAIAQPAEAGGVVEDELHSAARVVARALRLRIRLAPGVELVSVLGSRKLDVRSVSRVKAAEKAQDQIIARQLGIEADRGRDEEGIQIVVPAFHAGDGHAIVIDVITPGTGPVADVRLRYKDLVNFTNAVSRASLSLSAGEDVPSPLNRNVLKNELAIHVAQAARRAAAQLTNGNPMAAARTLQGELDLLHGLREGIPGWREDLELQRDETLLVGLFQALRANDGVELAGALTLAAFRRLNPPYQ